VDSLKINETDKNDLNTSELLTILQSYDDCVGHMPPCTYVPTKTTIKDCTPPTSDRRYPTQLTCVDILPSITATLCIVFLLLAEQQRGKYME